ncbi:MAG: tetratricopeptide repeat protein [Proteobacteria bacterium]|nr:tetratricopeptide repeat protein [Pseudomonadota bacterium]MBU1639960.1 tetratricopeptide repeat protein [Pseudomonadota bacterium]
MGIIKGSVFADPLPRSMLLAWAEAIARFFGLALFLIVLCFFSSRSASCAAADDVGIVTSPEQAAQQEKLWAEAEAFLDAEDTDQAALYFKHYWKTYPQAPRAAEALWQAALLYKQQALRVENPDWAKVKDLFYAYIVDFPNSPRIPDAYAEVGDSYFYMGFYREAQNYYALFLKQYPKHEATNQVLYMRARSLFHVGKFSQASDDFTTLQLSKDREFRLRGEAGQAYVHFFKGEWHDALGIFKRIHRQNPDYYLIVPEILRDMGIAAIRVGDIQEGRDYILHYINIGENALVDDEAYFEVAESFLQEGVLDGARVFYEFVIAKTKPQDKYAILSKFRVAQFGAANLDTMSEKERLAFFKKNGDKPFQEVLDTLYDNPLAQDARYSLFERYVGRQEWERAYNLGKSYLRYKPTTPKEQAVVKEELGKILVGWITDLLASGKYADVRVLYEKEFPVIADYKKADLLILIGDAYAQQTLYDQASVIYYRALGQEIDDEQKVKLYFKRAEVYLANNDLQSAQRLLKYLRRLYQNQPAIAEVNWLSARLRTLQKRPADALEFYKMAVESGGKQEKKGVYAADYLQQLFALNDLERVADLIAMFREQQWLPAQQIQYWYGRLGVELSRDGKNEAAAGLYQRALAEGLPETSAEAQPIHLHLADLLMVQKKYQEALGHYRLAQLGQDKIIAQLAESRLNEYQIQGLMADVEAMF